MDETTEKLRLILSAHPAISLAILFGSMARGGGTATSDVDLAVMASAPLPARLRVALMEDIALVCGRPVDLIDLATVGEPLLGEIVSRGVLVIGTSSQLGDLRYKHVMDYTDFLPYRRRLLSQRRQAWIGG